MELMNADKKFIDDWTVMAHSLGFSPSTSQVFALLLLADRRMSYVEIMEKLNISRGNAHLSLQKLVDLKLVFKFQQLGERKEYFEAESDLWIVFEIMIRHFKHRSLDQLIERISEAPNRKTNAASGHLVRIKGNLKRILKEYANHLDHFPKMEKEYVLNASKVSKVRKTYY